MRTAGETPHDAAIAQGAVLARESQVQAMLRHLENGNRRTAMLAIPYGA